MVFLLILWICREDHLTQCLVLALEWGGTTYSWRSSQIIGLFVGFGLLLAVFFLIQWTLGDRATIPLKLLTQRTILSGSLYLMFVQMVNYAVSINAITHPAVPNPSFYGTTSKLLTLFTPERILYSVLFPGRARRVGY